MTTLSMRNNHPTFVSGRVAAVVALSLVAAACATGPGVQPAAVFVLSEDEGVVVAATAATTSSSTTTTTEPRVCTPQPGSVPERIDPTDLEAAAIAISQATFPCADHVALAPAGDAGLIVSAGSHSGQNGGPLLLVDGDPSEALLAELARLAPTRLSLAGFAALDANAFGGPPVERITGLAVAAEDDPLSADPDRLWIVDEEASSILPVVRRAAQAAGDRVVVAGGDLRGLAEDQADAIRTAGAARIAVVGLTEDAVWQTRVVMRGDELPGGGLLMFPGRRLVAFYGHPGAAVLGVLGEQGPNATIDRMRPIVADYEADGIPAIPTFEIIATVADAYSGEDGDYSAESTLDALRPWVEVARERGAYVVLDLQPGRTDFLTQAKRYEELLRQPHVGLALDPEWRLKPDQFHLRQIGSVEAAEINTVIEWLAGIVREEALPQKLLVLHQFRVDMIKNRELVETTRELAFVVHADGQGPLGLKYDTWGVLTTAPGAEKFRWGWKNFYDEDPQMATPAEVLALTPLVFMVSFQ